MSVARPSLGDMNPTIAAHHGGLRLIAVRDSMWRVIAPDERIIGHLERINTEEGELFRAQRFVTSRARFSALGDFWSADDAIDCLRCV